MDGIIKRTGGIIMEWTKVSDKLPPKDRPILFIVEDGSMHVAYPKESYVRTSFEYETGEWQGCCCCGGVSIIYCIDALGEWKKAVWWMQLPKAPEEDAKQ